MSLNLRSQRLDLDGLTDGSPAKLPNNNNPSAQGVSRRLPSSEFYESSQVSQKRLKSSQFSSRSLPALINPSQSATYLAKLSNHDNFTVLPPDLLCLKKLQLTNENFQRLDTG
jgi:hypothetical protein